MACKQLQMYQCAGTEDCRAIVEVVLPESCDCECDLTCCGKPMELLEEKTADFKTEKHVPVVEKIDGGVKVVVGSTPHPMAPTHWIQLIEVQSGGKVYRQYLSPGDAPEATFLIDGDGVVAREYCNKHGLWKS